jgi:hypothetical protein
VVSASGRAPGSAGFVRSASVGPPSSLGIVVAPSTATIAALLSGSPRCNTVAALAGGENAARIPSANTGVSAASGPTVAGSLAFRDGVYDSREGPWEVMAPRSSGPGGESHSSLGHSKPPAHCKIKNLAQSHLLRCGLLRRRAPGLRRYGPVFRVGAYTPMLPFRSVPASTSWPQLQQPSVLERKCGAESHAPSGFIGLDVSSIQRPFSNVLRAQ